MSYLGRSGKLSLKAQEKVSFLATAGQTVKTGLSYTVGFIEVYVNGVLLTDTTDFTATNGNSITFTVALLLNDEVTVISLKTFTVADHYTKSDADTLLAAKSPIASPAFTGGIDVTGSVTSDGVVTSENIEIAKASYPALKLNDGTAFSNIYHSPVNGGVVISVDDNNARASSDLITYIDGTEKMRIDSAGHAIIGGGVTLGNGTTYAAANTLDDYEEGTWTPVLKFDGNNAGMVFTGQGGFYTKVGNLVTVNSYYSLSDKGSSNGAAQIHGLPFAVANVTNNYIPVSLGFSGVSFADMMIGYCQPNQAYVNLREVSNAGSHTTIVQSNVANSGDMMMSVTYRTA